MKTRLIANKILFALAIGLIIIGCSDKYDMIVKADYAPVVVTDKQMMEIREKDYSNYFKNAGFIRVTAQDTMVTGLYMTALDTTGHLEIFYDSIKLHQPLPLNQATSIYVACKDTGVYPLTIRIVNRLNNVSEKVIPVKVISNTAPVGLLKSTLINYQPGRSIYEFDGGASTSKMGRIMTYSFYIDGVETTLYSTSVKSTLYTGDHEIGLIVTDDLGVKSTIVKEKIRIQ